MLVALLALLLLVCLAGFVVLWLHLRQLKVTPSDSSSAEAALQARLDAAEGNASSLKGELEELRKASLAAAAALARRETEGAGLSTECGRLRDENFQFKAEIELLRKASVENSTLLAQRDAALKSLSSDKTRLEEELSKAKTSDSSSLTKLRDAERENSSLSESCKMLRTALEDARAGGLKLEETLKVQGESLRVACAERAKLQAEFDALAKRLETQEVEIKRLQEESLRKFEAVAAKLLEEKGDKMSKLNVERLSEILGPLRENIGDFKKRFEELHEKDGKERAALSEQVRQISEVNRQVGEDAKRLTEALKGDSKVMGDWGEMLLDSILEGSGLLRDQEYFKQESTRDADGNLLRPDVLIKLPQGKTIIVDSKVSITAYLDYCNAADEAARDEASARHVKSVRAHVDELAAKDYQAHIDGTLDFVVMFIPNEPAYNLAMRNAPSLWEYAYNKKIVLSSPTNLFAVLKIASELWRKEREASNYLEIAERGAAIYDKLAVFLEFMDGVDKSLDDARKAYEKAANSLRDGRGNLIGQVEKMKQLGLKTKRQLDGTWLDKSSPELPALEVEKPSASL